MQVITCWDIQVWDGGDRHNHKFYVETKAEADKWMAKNTYDYIYEKKFEIFSSIQEWEESQAEATKKRALAKLTAVERKALGL